MNFATWHVSVNQLGNWQWPYPCHREGHTIAANGNCEACGATAASFERADLWSATTAPVVRVRPPKPTFAFRWVNFHAR